MSGSLASPVDPYARMWHVDGYGSAGARSRFDFGLEEPWWLLMVAGYVMVDGRRWASWSDGLLTADDSIRRKG